MTAPMRVAYSSKNRALGADIEKLS